ncbi:hypothetical protein EGW08_003175 [Elysia chlorotica]|uniref:Uncharacterized protein n=1 Tax=Elysia chlorotica TaxID=188477 RepID=A0A3S1BQH6_ELYCH|nr:hypothetical protein EGW08_003175 [Elysia chlorotica]
MCLHRKRVKRIIKSLFYKRKSLLLDMNVMRSVLPMFKSFVLTFEHMNVMRSVLPMFKSFVLTFEHMNVMRSVLPMFKSFVLTFEHMNVMRSVLPMFKSFVLTFEHMNVSPLPIILCFPKRKRPAFVPVYFKGHHEACAFTEKGESGLLSRSFTKGSHCFWT